MTNEKKPTHIDLFSGIGGFTLAGEWAGFKTIVFCEKEKFCQKVLKKHWSGIPIISEIRDFDGTKYRGATLLTGGFPCQPFSVAGQRRGKKDDRYLWPEMLKVISEAKPCWILAENVSGIFRMALDTVLADLEGEGYTTGTFIIPACGLNAPHRRNRIWIIANSRCQHGERAKNKGKFKRSISKEEDAPLSGRSIKDDGFRNVSNSSSNRHQRRCEETRGAERKGKQGRLRKSEGTNSLTSDSESRGIQGKSISIRSGQPRKATCDIKWNPQADKHPNSHNVQRGRKQSNRKDSLGLYSGENSAWQENWLEVAARFCRVDDGVSDRIHRLKALGNAIVPQIAYEILKNIAWIERNK